MYRITIASKLLAPVTCSLALIASCVSAEAQVDNFDLIVYAHPRGYAPDTGGPAGTVKGNGGEVAIIYSQGLTEGATRTYLTQANTVGLDVIIQVNTVWAATPATVDPDGVSRGQKLQDYVTRMNNHAVTNNLNSLRGWYIYDEPTMSVAGYQQGYDLIKAADPLSRPIYGDIDADEPSTQQNYYGSAADKTRDVLMTHDYPFFVGDDEFEGLENSGFLGFDRGWKHWMQQSQQGAASRNEPWVPVIQAFGFSNFAPIRRDDGKQWRLPTAAELRFMSYYNVAIGADSLAFWDSNFTYASQAFPNEPYPNDGSAWAANVLRPMLQELSEADAAFGEGAITAGVSDNRGDVTSLLYQDPNDDVYYLLAVNNTSGSETVTFTLSSLVGSFDEAIALDGGASFGITNNTFTGSLGDYGGRVFRLTLIPEPSSALLVGGLAALLLRRKRHA